MHIILISGKRFSGKDWFVSQALKLVNGIHLSPSTETKRAYCQSFGLDFDKFMTSREYKEEHRQGLIEYFNACTRREPRKFDEMVCKTISSNAKNLDFVFIDVRLVAQIEYYTKYFKYFKVRTIRVNASHGVRRQRGFVYCESIDTEQCEVDLDDYPFDFVFDNSCGTTEEAFEIIHHIR